MDLNVLLMAKTFAVVGASADVAKVGHQILRNLSFNPKLTVYPINLKGGTILGLKAYTHLVETPNTAEVVIVCVPVQAVESVIDECIKIHAKGVVLITSGFAEAGTGGIVLQQKIEAKLLAAKIVLLGPNSMGYSVPKDQIYATFGPNDISPGPIAVISQSGAMLSALFGEYSSSGTGISFAISLGNKTGIQENDALSYAMSDPNTKVVVLYLESLYDPARLLFISQQLSTKKPIFLLKGGITKEGSSAAISHTAALATSDILLDELCHQAGIIQVNNFEQLVRASIAAAQTAFLPENIMIITNAGGPAVVLTDEISEAGIPLVELSPTNKDSLTKAFPNLKINNPLDLLGDASPNDYQAALSILCNDLEIDAVVAVVTEQAVTKIKEITRILAKPRGKHILFACMSGGDEMEPYRQQLKLAGLVVSRYPNEIAETISLLQQAKKQMNKPEDIVPVISSGKNKYPETYEELTKLLQEFHIPLARAELISKEEELSNIKELGWPLIAKTTNLRLLHKAKIGAVIQDISNEADTQLAFKKLQEWGSLVVFQEKIKEGVEVLLGVHKDPFWGWYMAVGMGGSLSDTYDDRAYIFLPAPKSDLINALSRTKLITLLTDSTKKYLLDAMLNLQDCALSTLDISEIEINPLFVSNTGVIAADLKRA